MLPKADAVSSGKDALTMTRGVQRAICPKNQGRRSFATGSRAGWGPESEPRHAAPGNCGTNHTSNYDDWVELDAGCAQTRAVASARNT